MVAPGTDADEAAASIGAFLQLTYTPTCLSRWSRDPPRAQRSFAFFFFFFFDFFFFDFFFDFSSDFFPKNIVRKAVCDVDNVRLPVRAAWRRRARWGPARSGTDALLFGN